MIYCIPSKDYPNKEQFIEELEYKDENDFIWKIARIENGFIIKYFGDEYFKDNTFECELLSGNWISINNTNCIFFKDADFDAFCEMRDILKNGYTDDIWDTLNDFFTERFNQNEDILECEKIIK